MPNLHLKKEEIQDFDHIPAGKPGTSLPESYKYRPGDARRDIQEGWWVVKKYNCMGCHQFMPGQASRLMGIGALSGRRSGKISCRPNCMGEGARADPDWMRKFLANPAMEPRTRIATACGPT